MREWLRDLRGEKTCKQMAEELGITEAYYWLVEQGKRQKRMNVLFIWRLSQVTGVPVNDLVWKELQWER